MAPAYKPGAYRPHDGNLGATNLWFYRQSGQDLIASPATRAKAISGQASVISAVTGTRGLYSEGEFDGTGHFPESGIAGTGRSPESGIGGTGHSPESGMRGAGHSPHGGMGGTGRSPEGESVWFMPYSLDNVVFSHAQAGLDFAISTASYQYVLNAPFNVKPSSHQGAVTVAAAYVKTQSAAYVPGDSTPSSPDNEPPVIVNPGGTPQPPNSGGPGSDVPGNTTPPPPPGGGVIGSIGKPGGVIFAGGVVVEAGVPNDAEPQPPDAGGDGQGMDSSGSSADPYPTGVSQEDVLFLGAAYFSGEADMPREFSEPVADDSPRLPSLLTVLYEQDKNQTPTIVA